MTRGDTLISEVEYEFWSSVVLEELRGDLTRCVLLFQIEVDETLSC